MKLLLPSMLIAVYLLVSLVFPQKLRLRTKFALGAVLLFVSQKYIFYEFVGGSFFRPDLPIPVLLVAEGLYASLVVLFFLALLKDGSTLLCWLARRFGASCRLPFSPAVRGIALCLLALGSGIWGNYQAMRVPDVRTVEISIPQLPAKLDGFCLVQLSDIHIGPLLKRDWLNSVVKKVNAIKADAIVLTGDYIDGLPGELAQEVQPLALLKAKHGVFGVNGNHEYYYDAKGWQPVFRTLGVDMLNNEHRVLADGIVIGGVTDRNASRFDQSAPNVQEAFAGAPEGPRILLSHQPQFSESIPAKGVALQLSGHTHGGLMFFLKPLIAHFNKGFVHGLYDSGLGGKLYVSPGTGLWSGFACRIGVPSEITRIILKSEE